MLFDPAMTPDIILLENRLSGSSDWSSGPIDIKSTVIGSIQRTPKLSQDQRLSNGVFG